MENTQSKNSNKIVRNVFEKCATSLILTLALGACGQRGALFIPTVPEAAQRSSIVNTLTTPAADAQKEPQNEVLKK